MPYKVKYLPITALSTCTSLRIKLPSKSTESLRNLALVGDLVMIPYSVQCWTLIIFDPFYFETLKFSVHLTQINSSAPFSNIYLLSDARGWRLTRLSILMDERPNSQNRLYRLVNIKNYIVALLHLPTLHHMFNNFILIWRYRYSIFRQAFTPLVILVLLCFDFKILVFSVMQSPFIQVYINLTDFCVLF